MNKQDTSKKEQRDEQVQRVKLIKIIQGQTFYHIDEKTVLDIAKMTPDTFDRWAQTFVDSIVNVDRSQWDIFARWRFINTLLGEHILAMEEQPDGTIILRETELQTEEKASVSSANEGSVA